jgi:acetyl esterase/lipase
MIGNLSCMADLSDILERPFPKFDKRVTYGPEPQHFAELRFPKGPGPSPLLMMIHGGFWQAVYDLNHTGLLCADLTTRNVVTCNLEYRRLGNQGGGWPGTFQDISVAADRTLEILLRDPRVDTSRTTVMGHSAGGHLALWLVSRHKVVRGSPLYVGRRSPISNAISLSGVPNLQLGWKQHLGNGVVSKLMGGAPEEFPDRYAAGSPVDLLPTGGRQVLLHGTADNIVPISQSESFVRRAKEVGNDTTFVKLDGVGHFELIDPESSAWRTVAETVLNLLEMKTE